ncbi:riboflavin aldehyde-forming enzyme [Aspergillus sclerotialis]|uniref:Riboflavin aldehyde-forming enzyme n=1 Tax=Aspergillus sclerotialis TaxID=2070753 RepID=A0A3A2ZHT9_9EURO|nr:riboflavin aldehyde-forming enzyme [Aspergillus sclerotialis]
MSFADEKDIERPVSPISPNSPGAVDHNKPLPELKELDFHHPKNFSAPVPKRKPVPIAAGANYENGDGIKNYKASPRSIPQWLNWRQFSRRKRIVIVGAITAIVLIALIIGLAVGLTVGKGHKNLPLPTSHGGPYEGDLTYYDPALGSCGISSTNSDMICAVSHVLFDAASRGPNPNENPLCGMKIRVKRNGKSVDVKIVDRCVGCKETDLDVSRSAFKQLADIDQGRVLMEWSWLENSPVQVS